jgi:DNA-directed RNA polymerase specialized sigma24 family protein
MISSLSLLCCSSIGVAGFCLTVSFLLFKRQKTLRAQEIQRIQALQQKIDLALQDEDETTAREAFSVTLKAASLTTELQGPRLQNMAKINKQPPEKYKILSKLASQGMDAEEIASILDISRVEAGQLLSLCNMAKLSR